MLRTGQYNRGLIEHQVSETLSLPASPADEEQGAFLRKGFLHLHDSTQASFKAANWHMVVFQLSADRFLSYSHKASVVRCGPLDHLMIFHAMDFLGAPANWHGMLLQFDSTVPGDCRTLRLATRTPTERTGWLDAIASNVPRFQVPAKEEAHKEGPAWARPAPAKASLGILQHRGLVTPRSLNHTGWYLLPHGQLASAHAAALGSPPCRHSEPRASPASRGGGDGEGAGEGGVAGPGAPGETDSFVVGNSVRLLLQAPHNNEEMWRAANLAWGMPEGKEDVVRTMSDASSSTGSGSSSTTLSWASAPGRRVRTS